MLVVRCARSIDKVEEIGFEEVPALLRSAHIPLWFELDSPHTGELELLVKHLKIHDLTLEDIVKQNQRPKIESFDDYIYIAIHPLVRTDHLVVEPREVDLLVGNNWLALVHYGPVSPLANEHARERLRQALPRGVDFLLYAIVDLIVDSYFPLLDQIDDEIENLEDRFLDKTDIEDMDRLLTLKRSLVQIRRAVGPQRDIFNQLTRRDFQFVRPEYAVYFRDVYDHLIRITEELDSLRDILSGAMEVHLSSISNQLNIIMKRLTAWGTIFVIITAIAGIYGMNFEHMPELHWRYGYPAIMGLLAAVSLGMYLYFRRKGYF